MTSFRTVFTLAALVLAGTAVTGCTDTQRASLDAYGDSARVTCYSGGEVVADDFSTGKVANASNSDGYEFKSKTTGRLAQFSGDCVIDYGATPARGWQATLPGQTSGEAVRAD